MRLRLAIITGLCLLCTTGFAADSELPQQAAEAVQKVVDYLRAEIAAGGGYLGHYVFDKEHAEILQWWGEGRATRDQNWIQPPGNPTVGFAFLRAWEATGDAQYLDAAIEVALSLVRGQLACGGWDYIVDHSPEGAQRWAYRRNLTSKNESLMKGRNQGTFDDNVSQHATRLLIAVDRTLAAMDPAARAKRAIDEPQKLRFALIPEDYRWSEAVGQWHDVGAEEAVPWPQVLSESEIKFTGEGLTLTLLGEGGEATGETQVQFEFGRDQQKAFREFTAANVGRLLAVVLDDELIMAPQIRAPIPGMGIIQFGGGLPPDLANAQMEIRSAAMYALEFLLEAQYEFGGWPQRFPLSSRGYSRYATFNDNSIADCFDVMMRAWEAYGDERYRESVLQAGQFMIDAQLPDPQPTWAQQYDEDLKPGWARRFEPPAACAGESRGVIRSLIRIALFTGDDKYLEPIGPALDWYKRSELTGKDKGNWARFYELGTNKPLYFTAGTYRLTYDDSNVPTHYSFKGSYYPSSEEAQYKEIMDKGLAQYAEDHKPAPLTAAQKLKRAEDMQDNVRAIIAAQDDTGRWFDKDTLSMRTCSANINRLADYLRLLNDR